MRRFHWEIVLLTALFWVFSILLVSCGSKQPVSAEAVSFSREAGAWPEESFDLVLSAPKGCKIYYTTDGSLPDKTKTRYRRAIRITGNGNNWLTEESAKQIRMEKFFHLNSTPEFQDAWIIRAVAEAPDGTLGPVTTKTYLPGFSFTEEYAGFAVISLVTEPESLLSPKDGIMVLGDIYDAWLQSEEGKQYDGYSRYFEIPANYLQSGKDWERAASFELFDGGDSLTLQKDCGIRIHGGMSRVFPQRAFRVYFKKSYGGALEYPLFPEKGGAGDGEEVRRFSCVTLRSGGNTAGVMPYKDPWIQSRLSLLGEPGFGLQCARPVVLYLNGEFWGAYVLNDRYNSDLLEARYGAADNLLIKEQELQDGKEEDMVLYEELMAFAGKDLSDPEEWKRFSDAVDIEGMAASFAAEVYIANADFSPEHNTELWRSVGTEEGQSPYTDGKWRFLVYDTEYSMGLYGHDDCAVDHDSLADALENQPLFRAAMKNREFRHMFLQKLKEVGTICFPQGDTDSSLDEWAAFWNPLIEQQGKRFGYVFWNSEEEPEAMKDFLVERYENIVPAAERLVEQEDREEQQ